MESGLKGDYIMVLITIWAKTPEEKSYSQLMHQANFISHIPRIGEKIHLFAHDVECVMFNQSEWTNFSQWYRLEVKEIVYRIDPTEKEDSLSDVEIFCEYDKKLYSEVF